MPSIQKLYTLINAAFKKMLQIQGFFSEKDLIYNNPLQYE